MACELLAVIANCLREEEHRDALEEFYFVCHEGIGRYCDRKIELGRNRP
jgi:hypothetical protein